jgi:hypothetical protein
MFSTIHKKLKSTLSSAQSHGMTPPHVDLHHVAQVNEARSEEDRRRVARMWA